MEGIPFKKAQAVAMQLVDHLVPSCTKVGIVGSVRREKQIVKDIELCVIPALDTAQIGLFGDVTKRSEKFIEQVYKLGIILKGSPSDGRYVQIHLKEGIALDLFIPQPEDYYRQYAIRTGSADYSAKRVAVAWRKLGWVGTEFGLRREIYCEQTGKTWRWKDRTSPEQLPPVWKSEKEFFDWLKLPFLSPKFREVN